MERRPRRHYTREFKLEAPRWWGRPVGRRPLQTTPTFLEAVRWRRLLSIAALS